MEPELIISSFSILQDKAERDVASKCEDGATLNSIINVYLNFYQ